MENKFYFDRPETRAKILELFFIDNSASWQKVLTPLWVVKEMLDLIQDTPELLYIVLFNIEFLEELIYAKGVEPKRIMFMAGNKYKAALAMGMYGVKTFELPVEFREPKIAIEKTLEKISKAFYGGIMPVTNNIIVFGNPPYQSEDGGFGKSAMPIYHHFVEAVIDHIAPRYLSFIVPSRWMAGGRGLDKFRERMMEDKHLKIIKHFSGEGDIFKDVSIKGGVNYFLWDREGKGKCNFNGHYRYLNEYDIILSENEAVSILDKILASHKGIYLNSKCLPSKPFGLRTFFVDWKKTGTPCYSRGHEKHFVDPSAYTDEDKVINLWKVGCAKTTIEGADFNGDQRKYINGGFIIEPGAICTETYIVINTFKTEKEAINFIAYAKTIFFRFLLGLRTITQDITRERFTWVPDLGPYNKVWTDADLYKRFKLTPKEIAYIESKIKPIG
jgi:Eco57I restriction endonuclease.